MKIVSVKEVKNNLSQFLKTAEQEDIIITKNGRPNAVIHHLGEDELEDYVLEHDLTPDEQGCIHSKRGTTHDLNRLAGCKTELSQALSKPVGTCYGVDAALFVWCEISERLHSRTRVYFRMFFLSVLLL